MATELRDYLKLFWNGRRLIVLVIAMATAVAMLVANTRPVTYAASQSFAINRINREATPDYQYDGYYALQAADLFAQTVVSWFRTPSILQQVYDTAQLDPNVESLNSLADRFAVKKYSAQNIVVRFHETTRDRARVVADTLPKVLAEKTNELNQTSTGKSLFEIVGTTPVIVTAHPPVLIVGGLTLLLSFAGALLLVAARHYLRT